MKRELFNKFYDKIVLPSANNLIALNNGFEFVGNKESLYASYQEQKTFLGFYATKIIIILRKEKICLTDIRFALRCWQQLIALIC